MPVVYTHAQWRVLAGQEEAFVEAWSELARAFSSLERKPLWGTLIRSVDDPRLFYSFGPWEDASDVAAMRADPGAQAAMRHLIGMCEQASPALYTLVRHVEP